MYFGYLLRVLGIISFIRRARSHKMNRTKRIVITNHIYCVLKKKDTLTYYLFNNRKIKYKLI